MGFDHRTRGDSTVSTASYSVPLPGKHTLTEGLSVQRREAATPGRDLVESPTASPAPAPPGAAASSSPRPTLQMLFGGQLAATAAPEPEVHAAAARGTATPASKLPHADPIQRAFGRHDISGIQAHVGGDAAASARAMGARAYATGDHVVLGADADLHTVAHEATHVIQQRGGVQLSGGVGDVGDRYERHADEVADLVVQGRSAEAALDGFAGAGSGGARSRGVQRAILGGATRTNFGTLGQALEGLTDIDLVKGKSGLDLEIKFAELKPGENGLTTVWGNGKRINPHVDITPQAAKDTAYKILIELNEETFQDGTSAAKNGQLYETIIHEWELHGRQHAINLSQAKAGKESGQRIDHVNLFDPGSTDMDKQIARRILEEKAPETKQQIFNAYMMDVFAHIYHLQVDHLVTSNQTRGVVPVDMLIKYLKAVMGSLGLWKSLFGTLAETDPLRAAATELARFGQQNAKDYDTPKDYKGPRTLPVYSRTDEWIEKVNALLGAPLPRDNEILEVGFEQLRPDLKWALVYLHELHDTRSVPEISMVKEDDKEGWKKSVLAPRMRHLESLGVDVNALNKNLNLREDGAREEAYQTIPVDFSSELPLVSPPSLKPSGKVAQGSREEDESVCAEKFRRGELGLYHRGSVLQEFSPDIARQILDGAHGPFGNKNGQLITFKRRASSGDCFYFDSPYLHSSDWLEQTYSKMVDRGELGLYRPEAIWQDFLPEVAKQILEGAKGPFVNRHGQRIAFAMKAASHDGFYFDAPHLH
jgi:hypothetical protein